MKRVEFLVVREITKKKPTVAAVLYIKFCNNPKIKNKPFIWPMVLYARK